MESSTFCSRSPESKRAHNSYTFLPLISFWQIITYLYLFLCFTEGGAYHAGRHPGHSDWTGQSCLLFQAAGWKSCSKWVFSVSLKLFFYCLFYRLISSLIINLADHVRPGERWAAFLKHCCIPWGSTAKTQHKKQDWHHGMLVACSVICNYGLCQCTLPVWFCTQGDMTDDEQFLTDVCNSPHYLR